jgi:cytochrome c oxidase assembly protein subunit 15
MTSLADSVRSSPAPVAAASRALVRAWLLATAALVFLIVIVGGATRLTESGLSITEWEVVTGVLPPLTEAQWQAEFEKYRRIPQYQQVNRGMSLAEFQVIYLWEWGHRILGRVIGLVFLGGFLWFLATRKLDRTLAWKTFGIGCLIGLQGFIGWWMVSSGLVDRIAVAPYRLATHLTLACVIFACLVWLARDLASPRVAAADVPASVSGASLALLVLLFAQIFLGGLVAGSRAGYVYQTWPLIDGGLWPAGMLVMEPWWKNLFENTATTQFVHRTMAYLILGVAAWHAFDATRRLGAANPVARRARLLFAVLLVQGVIGVATLLTGMNILVALAHQAWIVPVLFVALVHRHAIGKGAGAHGRAGAFG